MSVAVTAPPNAMNRSGKKWNRTIKNKRKKGPQKNDHSAGKHDRGPLFVT